MKNAKESLLAGGRRILIPHCPCGFFILFFLVFSLILTGNALVCAETKKRVTIKGIDRIWGDTEGDITFLEGELVATQDKTVIYAPRAEMNKETKVAIFRDGVKLVQEEVTITGENLEIDFDHDLGAFSGDVRLEREETRDEQGEIEKERIELTCAFLEMNTETKDFTAWDHVVMKHTDFTATALRLVYLDREEVMTFSGDAYLVREQEEVRGEEIRIELQKKIFEVKGGAEVSLEVDEEEEENDGAKMDQAGVRTEEGRDGTEAEENVEGKQEAEDGARRDKREDAVDEESTDEAGEGLNGAGKKV